MRLGRRGRTGRRVRVGGVAALSLHALILSAVLQSAFPAGIARLDLELDALVVAEAGGGGSGSGSGRRSRGRHLEQVVLCWLYRGWNASSKLYKLLFVVAEFA